jgi:hypothetical protein
MDSKIAKSGIERQFKNEVKLIRRALAQAPAEPERRFLQKRLHELD